MSFDFQFAVNTFWIALSGVPNTLLITLVALLIGLPLGFFIALSRVYKIPIIQRISGLYISFVRGTPIIVQIFIVFFSLPGVLAAIFRSMDIGINIYSVNPIYYAFIVFAINASASFAEMWKAALHSVGNNQIEAGHTVGLTTAQTYRHVIIPQALVVAAPSITSTSIFILKNTSLVFLMSVQDIVAKAKIEAGIGFNFLEAYTDILIIYVIFVIIIEKLFKLAEKKLRAYKVDPV